MADYLPRTDTELLAWLNNFVTILTANLAGYNLVAGDLTDISAGVTSFGNSLTARQLAENAAQAATADKDNKRALVVALVRAMVTRLQADSEVSSAEKEAIAIPVADLIRTAAGIPGSRPVAQVDTSQRLQHTVSWKDEHAPTSIKKPDGIRGAELFLKIGGAAPLDLKECTYIATDTKTPYTYTFEGSEGGEMAHWLLRWVNGKGEAGPISETVSATIGG